MARPLVIITNADQVFLDMMAEVLNDAGYDALTVKESHHAFELVRERQPALVIIELLIIDPERGLMIVNKMRLDPSTTTIPVIIASTSTPLLRDNAAHLRAKRCEMLQKPFDLEELLALVERSLQS